MELTSPLIAILAGILCGIISGFGIGGGSLLMVWMTAVVSLDQKTAQGINLLYFFPTALAALVFHIKNNMIRLNIVLPAALAGCISAAFAAWISSGIEVDLLRKLFGMFLIVIGITELRNKNK